MSKIVTGEVSPRIVIVREAKPYGKLMYYPVCDRAKAFAELVGQDTLTPDDVAKIKALGFSVTTEAAAGRKL